MEEIIKHIYGLQGGMTTSFTRPLNWPAKGLKAAAVWRITLGSSLLIKLIL